jgi:drug/metabolite transporter (DMT)-like permease
MFQGTVTNNTMEDENKGSHFFIATEEEMLSAPLVEKGESEHSYQNPLNGDGDDTGTDLNSTNTAVALVSLSVGRSLLILVAFLYGTLNVSLRFVYGFPDPPSASALSSTRGWLAALCFIPLLLKKNGEEQPVRETPQRPLWGMAAELAVWNFGAQGLLTLGLLSTESARASFLTQTSVVMTPLVSALAGQKVNPTVWLGAVCALGGLLLLSDDGGLGNDVSASDLIVLAGALCWSLYVFRLSSIGDSYDEITLQAAKTFILALLYSAWFVVAAISSATSLWPGWTNLAVWGLIFYSALGPGAFADIIQQKGQAVIAASEANIILSMEPVFTAVFGRLILGEVTSWQEKLGGGLILLAALIATR